jgi:predicted component of type VI protein secretion system
MRAQLVPLDGGEPILLTKDLVVVGRRQDCDLRLDHKSVSKIHCVLVKTDGLLMLRDLGSTNGTRVNGTRVRRAALLPNDQLSIAHYRFRITLGPDPEPPAGPHEHTEALSMEDVERLVRHSRKHDEPDSDEIPSPQPELLQRNQLPDVYPEEQDSSH